MRRKNELESVLAKWRREYSETDSCRKIKSLYFISKQAWSLRAIHGDTAVDDLLYLLANKRRGLAKQIERMHLLTWKSIKRAIQLAKKSVNQRESNGASTEQAHPGNNAGAKAATELFTFAHLLAIASVESKSQQQRLLDQCSAHLWSLRKLQFEIRKRHDSAAPADTTMNGSARKMRLQNASLVNNRRSKSLKSAVTGISRNVRNGKSSNSEKDELLMILSKISEFESRLKSIELLVEQTFWHCHEVHEILSRLK